MFATAQRKKHSDDVVRLGTGTLIQVRSWGVLLRAAGIGSKVVGDDRTAGLGTVVPGTVELWVHREDAAASEATIARAAQNRHGEPGRPSASPFGKSTYDPTWSLAGGP
jgi:hypothetical protein